jgi:hypothetical protein
MPALSEYSNVYNTALSIIKKKGYQLWYDEEAGLYCAERDGWDFMAESPCGLLGVLSIYETKQPSDYSDYWWREEIPNISKNLPRRPEPYVSVTKRRNKG